MVHQMIELAATGLQYKCALSQDATINGRTLIDIAQTIQKNTDIIPQQIAVHVDLRSDIWLPKMAKISKAHYLN